MEDLMNFINKIKSKIPDFKNKNINEAQTKEWLIKPFFELLGWDFSNPDEVVPEDDDSTGKRPDYCFYINEKAKLLMEAKQINNSLDDNKMITEKINYCSNAQVPFLIITNGVLYRVYYSELKGSGKDKLLQEFSIIEEFDEETEEIIDKLRKSNVEQDKLLSYAKNIFILTNIKKTIESLFQFPNKKIINIINEKLKEILGHKFGNDEIEESLHQLNIQINTDVHEPPYDSSDDDKQKHTWTIEYQFKDKKWDSSYNLYKKLVKKLKESDLSFEENPTKIYIGFISSNINFCQIHGQKSGLKIWINLEMTDLSEQETLKIRDVASIGHWGTGNTEAVVNNESDFDWILPLIKKSYNKNVTN